MFFTFKFIPSFYKGNYKLQITDIRGKVYNLGKVALRAGGSVIDVNIADMNLSSGSYFIRIIADDGKRHVMKIVVQ